jgi:hypothetical protein
MHGIIIIIIIIIITQCWGRTRSFCQDTTRCGTFSWRHCRRWRARGLLEREFKREETCSNSDDSLCLSLPINVALGQCSTWRSVMNTGCHWQVRWSRSICERVPSHHVPQSTGDLTLWNAYSGESTISTRGQRTSRSPSALRSAQFSIQRLV